MLLHSWEGEEVRKSWRRLWTLPREKARPHSSVHPASRGVRPHVTAHPACAMLPQTCLRDEEPWRGSVRSQFPCSARLADLYLPEDSGKWAVSGACGVLATVHPCEAASGARADGEWEGGLAGSLT